MADTRETKTPDRTRSYAGRSPGSAPSYRRSGGSTSVSPRQSGTSLSAGASPFSMMRRMLEDMDRMFFDFAGGGVPDVFSGAGLERGIWSPQVETLRRGDQLVVRADLPGMTRENVNVEVEDDTLLISGERQDEYNEERDDFYRSERSYGRFFRAIPLPEGIDPNSAKAEFKDGVLEVSLPMPKETPRQSRGIAIQ